MVSLGTNATRRLVLLLPAVLLSGSAFVFPGSRLRPAQPLSRRVSCETVVLSKPSCWGVRRRATGPCMAVASPGDEDGEATAGDDGDDADDGVGSGAAGGDAGEGISAEGSRSTPGNTDADADAAELEEDVNEVEATPFYGERTDEAAPLKLISQGDSLPLSYRSDNGTRESEFYLDAEEKEKINPYYDVVRRLSPTELIGRFMKTSSPRVQEAVRTTVLGLLGSLPRHAFETTAISTGDALANLMFQLQMTGYMFKNAEYRLSLQSSMLASTTAALPSGEEEGSSSRVEMDDDGNLNIARPKISGKIKLTYDAERETERELEVDADAYMAELRGQVEQLESRLLAVQNQREETVQKDLLVYIKSMPENQLQSLTTNVSPEVLESMRLLVQTVMGGMGNSEILSQTLTQQTGSGMAQLCMWQLVVGFNLREMEAREDLRKKFNK